MNRTCPRVLGNVFMTCYRPLCFRRLWFIYRSKTTTSNLSKRKFCVVRCACVFLFFIWTVLIPSFFHCLIQFGHQLEHGCVSLPSSNDVGGDAECSDSAAGEHDERSNSGPRSCKSTGSGEAYSKQVLGFVGWWKIRRLRAPFFGGGVFPAESGWFIIWKG